MFENLPHHDIDIDDFHFEEVLHIETTIDDEQRDFDFKSETIAVLLKRVDIVVYNRCCGIANDMDEPLEKSIDRGYQMNGTGGFNVDLFKGIFEEDEVYFCNGLVRAELQNEDIITQKLQGSISREHLISNTKKLYDGHSKTA